MLKQSAIAATITLIILSGCSRRSSEPEKSIEEGLQTGTNPRYAAKLICYIGKLGSGSNCSMVINDPNKPKNSRFTATSQSMRCGTKGQVSEITWKFIERTGDNDIYSFTRLFPADANEHTSTTRTIGYNGRLTIIFEDEYQAVVLEPPK